MLKLVQQTIVGQATGTQRTGILIHPIGELILLYSISLTHTSDTFFDYCTEQFEHNNPTTTLELHQLLERCISTAERMGVELSLIGVGILNERVVLAAYQGSLWLRRGQKSGALLRAQKSLQIVEGKTQLQDIYVLFTQAAQPIEEILQSPLEKVSAKNALELTELAVVRSAVRGALQEAEMGVTVIEVKETTQMIEQGGITPTQLENTQVRKPNPLFNAVLKIIYNIPTTLTKLSTFLHNQVEQIFSEDMYVRRRKRRSVGKILIISLVVLFGAIGIFAFIQNHQVEQRKQITAVLQPFETRLKEVRGQVAQNPIIARQQTEQLITDLETQSQAKTTPKFIAQALIKELSQVKAFYQSISGQEELPELQPYYDLRLVQSDFLASKIDITPDTLFFLDVGQKKVLALNIEKKQPTLLPIGEYPDIRAIVADEKYVYFLAKGLFRFTLSGTEVAGLVENEDDIINTSQSLAVFGNYVYVLNKEHNNIFRYATNDDQLNSKPTAWIQPGQGVDMNTVQSFAIDGDIWLATQTGEVKKFTSGKQAAFTVTGLKEPLSSPIILFTKTDLENLYILEPQKSRVVVLNKKGQFLKEIKSSSLAGSTAVVASEKFQKIFALSGSLVFEIGL